MDRDVGGAVRRLEAMVAQRPGFGASTTTAVTTWHEGMRCTTAEGPWVTATDLGSALGGDGTAPTPGALARAALGSCMAMTYRLRAARHGVELAAVRVTVESDAALAGMLVDDGAVRPGFGAVRYHVEIESSSPPADVRRIVDEGDRLSPILDLLRDGTDVCRTLSITPGTR